MALSVAFSNALKIYKFERNRGTLNSNRERLLQRLESILHQKCRHAFPLLSYHTLWRLRDGSLGLVIRKCEMRTMGALPPDDPRFAESRELAVLEDAAANRVCIAPVSPQLKTKADPDLVARIDSLVPQPPAVLRELRRIYKLRFRGRLLYGYVAREREIPPAQLGEYLGKPLVELWQVSKKNRCKLPVDMV